MKLTMKKTLAFLLALTMLLSCGSFHVFADASEDKTKPTITKDGSDSGFAISDGKVYYDNTEIATLPTGININYFDYSDSTIADVNCSQNGISLVKKGTGKASDGYEFAYATSKDLDSGLYDYYDTEPVRDVAVIQEVWFKLVESGSTTGLIEGYFYSIINPILKVEGWTYGDYAEEQNSPQIIGINNLATYERLGRIRTWYTQQDDERPIDGSVEDFGAGNYTVWKEINSPSGLMVCSRDFAIDPAPVNITTGSASKTYDGEPLTNSEASITGLVNGETATVTATGSQTEFGSSSNTYSIDWGTVKEANYTITEILGTLEVEKKPVTITTGSASKIYDGKALTNSEISISGLAEGETVTVNAIGSQTEVGSSDNTYSIVWGTANKNNYTITENLGKLTVTQAITLTAADDEKTYDGTPLTKNEVKATGLPEGFTVEATASGSQTDVGSSANKVNDGYVIKNASGENMTANFTSIKKVDGTLTVNPKQVTITAGSSEKVYDGTALTKDSYTNTALATGDSIESVKVTGSQTVVGTSDNVPSAAVIKRGDTDVTNNYAITYVNGTLKVTKKNVDSTDLTLTLPEGPFIYDGTAKEPTITVKDGTDDIPASEYDVSYSNNINAGEATVRAEAKANGNYAFSGSTTFQIQRAQINPTVSLEGWMYGDTPKTPTVDGNSGGASISYSYKVKDADDSTYVADVPVNAGTYFIRAEIAQSANYESGSATTEFTISPKDIRGATVTLDYDSFSFNGAERQVSVTEVTLGSERLDPNTDFEVSGVTKETGVDTYPLTITGKGNYTGTATKTWTIIKGQSSVDKTPVKAESLTYNGSSQSLLMEAGVMANGTVQYLVKQGETVVSDWSAEAKATNAGTYTVQYKFVPNEGYEIAGSSDSGSLEVTIGKKPLTITADSGTKVYDGTALTKNSYTNTALATGDSIGYMTVTGQRTVAGISDNVPSAAVIENDKGKDVTASYAITYAKGTLEVTKKAVTITADSGTKVYDGTALTKSYTNTALAAGDTIASMTVSGSQTVVGRSNNVPSAAVIKNNAGDDVTASYEITYANGTLEVTKKAVTITADSASKVYDGTALSKNTATCDNLAAGDRIESVTVTGSQTVVGSSDNVPSAAKIVNAAGTDVTGSYNISYANGTLTVNQKTVTITAGSASKVYDGTPLTENSYTNTALAAGDRIESVTVTGSRTDLGTSDNVPSAAVIKNGAGNNVTTNYEITYANGTLTVLETGAPTPNVLTYTGAAQQLVTPMETATLTWEFSTDNINWSTAIPTGINAGDYNVYWKVHNGDNSISVQGSAPVPVSIAKAPINPVVSILNWRTDRTPSEPTVIGNTGNGAVTYAYKVRNAQDSTYSAARPGTVGDYTIRATIAETQNYLGATVTSDFSISAAPSGGITGGSGGSSTVTRIGQNEAPPATETVNIVDDSVPLAGGIIFVVKVLDESTGYRGSAAQDSNGIIRITITDANGIPTAYTGPVLLTAIGPMTGDVVVEIDPATGDTVDLIEKSCVEADAAYALTHGGAALKIINNAGVFTDVMPFDWFYDAARFVSAHELFKGYADGSFQPNANTTRAMLVTVLHRLENRPSSDIGNLFPDLLNDQYYSEGMKWGTEQKIIMGYEDGLCRPDQNVSRQEMAVILYRYKRYLGYDVSARADLSAFADAEDIGDWALEAMQWAVASGIISGRTDDLLDPAGFATRAEVATMIMRIVEDMVK